MRSQSQQESRYPNLTEPPVKWAPGEDLSAPPRPPPLGRVFLGNWAQEAFP